jgi:S1-C subfamily serine protease
MVGIHEIFTATTIVISLLDSKQKSSATGFFFCDDEKNPYLVTNKHVIYGENYYTTNPQPQINQIRLNLHTKVEDLSQNEEVTLDLLDGNNRKWLEHSDPFVDIVLIPVNLDRAKYVLLALDRSYFDSENILIYFEKIFVMGYPFGWYDQVNNLPITRVGNLSSPFGVPFRGHPYMLGDVETHPGMSGGPVLMDLQDYTIVKDGQLTTYPGRRKFLLVGINSGQQLLPGTDQRPNLIVIWFPELIHQIIQTRSKKS